MELILMDTHYFINIPAELKIILWKKDKITRVYILSDKKKLKLAFFENEVKIDKWFNALVIHKKDEKLRENKTIKKIYNFLKSWNIYVFNKIKFKGKGFRIKFFKKIKLIKFYFGRSHRTFVFLKNVMKKRITKYKFLIYSLKKFDIYKSSRIVVNIKPMNFYTLRGIRYSRQIIYKRKGKKGTYI